MFPSSQKYNPIRMYASSYVEVYVIRTSWTSVGRDVVIGHVVKLRFEGQSWRFLFSRCTKLLDIRDFRFDYKVDKNVR